VLNLFFCLSVLAVAALLHLGSGSANSMEISVKTIAYISNCILTGFIILGHMPKIVFFLLLV